MGTVGRPDGTNGPAWGQPPRPEGYNDLDDRMRAVYDRIMVAHTPGPNPAHVEAALREEVVVDRGPQITSAEIGHLQGTARDLATRTLTLLGDRYTGAIREYLLSPENIADESELHTYLGELQTAIDSLPPGHTRDSLFDELDAFIKSLENHELISLSDPSAANSPEIPQATIRRLQEEARGLADEILNVDGLLLTDEQLDILEADVTEVSQIQGFMDTAADAISNIDGRLRQDPLLDRYEHLQAQLQQHGLQ